MKKTYKIYCDLDGVLVDFDNQFLKYGGIPPREFENNYGKAKFWDLINKAGIEFWEEMSWMPEGRELWDYIEKYSPIILSAPSLDITSRQGKTRWKHNNIPGASMILAFREEKQNYSQENSILIDDRHDNIEEWNSKGGIGILFENTKQTINELKQLGI